MDRPQTLIYEFGNFRLDAAKRLLLNGEGEIVPLMPKALDTLLYLVRNNGKVIEKDELMREIWTDTIVEENNLTQNISILRRVLGEKPGEHRFIVTVPGHGYKFVAEVRETDKSEEFPAIPSDLGISHDKEASNDDSDDGVRVGAPAPAGQKPNRYWLAGLAIVSLFALSSMGFLYWWENAGQTNAGSIRSIAVLPFKPITAENRDESLEMGMADALISKLNSGEQITVRQLNAVRRFASLEQDSISAGRELGVEAVLDGNIQTSGDRVRVSAKLIRVGDGKQLWAGQFDEKFTDIFALQDSISERVANALQISLGTRRIRRNTESIDAYQLYMKGDFHRSKLIMPEVQKAIAYYEQAIAADPSYALAYVGIEGAYRAIVLTNDARPIEVMPKAKAAALKAIEIDETLAEAHSAFGMSVFWYDWDWPVAEKHYLRALELDPNSSQTHFSYAHLLSNTGRHDDALREIRRARELDPVSLVTNALEGQILFFAGKEDEALRVLQSTAEMEPNFWLAHLFMTRIYLRKEMYSDAIASATRARDITRGNSEAVASLGYALARSGKADEARTVLRDLENTAADRYVPYYAFAQIHNALGNKENALTLLEKAFNEKDALMVFLKVELKWDNLRSEPRFVDLMKRMKFEN